MADRRAKRLQFYVQSMLPADRATLAEFAQSQFESWRLAQQAGVIESSLAEQQLLVGAALLAVPAPVRPVTPGPSPEARCRSFLELPRHTFTPLVWGTRC